jgi:hypothetical protein
VHRVLLSVGFEQAHRRGAGSTPAENELRGA